MEKEHRPRAVLLFCQGRVRPWAQFLLCGRGWEADDCIPCGDGIVIDFALRWHPARTLRCRWGAGLRSVGGAGPGSGSVRGEREDRGGMTS